RLGPTDRLCETFVSWRLLAGGLSPWLSHRSYSTTSEEPPLSNFNSYRDIPALSLELVSIHAMVIHIAVWRVASRFLTAMRDLVVHPTDETTSSAVIDFQRGLSGVSCRSPYEYG